MTPLRVGIVGAGKLGQTHARHWRNVPGASVAAAVDVNPGAAQALLAGQGQAFADVKNLLSVGIDVVDVCTPTPLHKDAALLAAQAGCAVFVEKPLARTLAECDAIVQAATEYSVPIGVAHVVRYFPAFRRARMLIQSGAVGAPVMVRTARLAGFPSRPNVAGNWYADPAQSGGVILDALLHDFDWLLWCFGPVIRIYARDLRGQAEHVGRRDYALVTLRFLSGTVAHVTGSWTHSGPLRASFEICGDAGMLEYDSAHASSVRFTAVDGGSLNDNPLAPEEDPYFAELADFARCVKNRLPPPIPAYEARDAVRVALAALQSADTGQVVTL